MSRVFVFNSQFGKFKQISGPLAFLLPLILIPLLLIFISLMVTGSLVSMIIGKNIFSPLLNFMTKRVLGQNSQSSRMPPTQTSPRSQNFSSSDTIELSKSDYSTL